MPRLIEAPEIDLVEVSIRVELVDVIRVGLAKSMAFEGRIEVNKARQLGIILLNSSLEKLIDFRHKTVKNHSQFGAKIGGRRYP